MQRLRRVSTAKLGEYRCRVARGLRRRRGWFLHNLTVSKLWNMLVASVEFALKRERLISSPIAVKIDISPLCNLRCTSCVHADANGDPTLEKQHFKGKQRMAVDQYQAIIDQVKKTATAVSLYYLGDPIVHPDMDEMCTIAREARLNVHISTNLSVPLSDKRVRSIVDSGLTHLTVCVDGLSQEKYELTRVGGRIDLVLSNLRRICQYRREVRSRFPKIEVQYIKFQHNVDEVEEAQKTIEELGVDQFTSFWGSLENWTARDPGNYELLGARRKKLLPQCFWPYYSTVIKFNGDVIPCCCFRHGSQYTEHEDPRVLGNVFETSLREVWNSAGYQESRRLVSNPQTIESEPNLAGNFCHGCTALFESDRSAKVIRSGENYRYEEIYELSVNGQPIRRREEEDPSGQIALAPGASEGGDTQKACS